MYLGDNIQAYSMQYILCTYVYIDTYMYVCEHYTILYMHTCIHVYVRMYVCTYNNMFNLLFCYIEKFTPIDVPQPRIPEVPREIPPYEGFQIGSEEDSLANCLNLIPKPPKRDFIKFMERDR